MSIKTKFTLKDYDADALHKKTFTKVQAAFDLKEKLQKKGHDNWTVYAITPFGNIAVFPEDKWKWQ